MENITIPTKEWNELKSIVIGIRDDVSKLTNAAQKELLSPSEVRELLKIGKSTYQRYVNTKVFEQIKLGKGKNSRAYVKRSEIERLIAEGKI